MRDSNFLFAFVLIKKYSIVSRSCQGGMVCTALLAAKYLSRDQLGHGGTLVNISQHIDIKSTAQLPIYTATKHAIIGLSQSLAVRYLFDSTNRMIYNS